MQDKNITAWLESDDYKSNIKTLAEKIKRESSFSKNESETSSIFEKHLYYYIRLNTELSLEFNKETPINNVNHKFGILTKRKSGKGRLDAVVNNLIIEYKHKSKFDSSDKIKTAFNQVEDYLTALKNTEDVEYNAILTDGIKIAYFQFCNGKLESTNLSEINENDIDLIIKAIVLNNTKKFTPHNILYDFSVEPNSDSPSKKLAKTLFEIIQEKPTEKTSMLFQEWQSLMHLSINDNGKSSDIEKRRRDLSLIFQSQIDNPLLEFKALFSLQTTYAIIVKLIACKVIDRVNYKKSLKIYYDLTKKTSSKLQEIISNIEDGYTYKNNNINNFLEGDFFSWYADKNQWSEDMYKSIFPIITTLDSYSAFSFNIVYDPIDVFKDLYMSIIPKSVRHSMGEYFTPEWLADYVVKNSIDLIKSENWKAIDPCCGSGIFLISLIKNIVGNTKLSEISEKNKKELKKTILERVYGIDINPLSVLSARVGYYLALLPFGDVENVDIPVYLGDSAIIPEKTTIGNSVCYKYRVTNLKLPFDVVLPESFVNKKNFPIIMNNIQSLMNDEDSKLLYAHLLDEFDESDKNNAVLCSMVVDFVQKLVELHKNQWDGIWVRIVTNFMLIARLKSFDIIVGNPPWVKWEHLPAIYADRIKETCDIKHIFCNDGGQYGGTQLNICALIANVTATNWLSENGVLSFLMPDSIMSQNSYEEFRNFYINFDSKKRLFLQQLDRWNAPLRPFQCGNSFVSQDFNTYYFQYKKIDYSFGVPVTTITREKSISDLELNKRKNFESVKENLVFGNTKAVQFSKNSTAFSYSSEDYNFQDIIGETAYLYRTGVEFTPQEIYMLTGVGKSESPNSYKFIKKEFKRSKYIVDDTPNGGWNLPTEFVYPMLTAPNMQPFSYSTKNEFCIVPYSAENTKTPMSLEDLLKTNKNLFLYLVTHKNLIDQQSDKSKMMHRGNEFYALSKIGKYTFAKYIVAARDNTKFYATVVNQQETPWGEKKQTICVKHTIIISQRKDESFIGEDEAFYICGILNSDIVSAYIKNSFKSNGISLNKSNLYLPQYSPENKLQKEIAEISKRATNKEINIKDATKKISELYIKLAKER